MRDTPVDPSEPNDPADRIDPAGRPLLTFARGGDTAPSGQGRMGARELQHGYADRCRRLKVRLVAASFAAAAGVVAADAYLHPIG